MPPALAVRELMRSDISALNQGVRNANDAISLIQTADGALGVIDEKLIRMKDLRNRQPPVPTPQLSVLSSIPNIRHGFGNYPK